jgi:taurine dioxygenase
MTSDQLTVNALPGLFGAQVEGVDLSQCTAHAVLMQLVNLLHENSVLVIHGQSLTDDQYAAFGRVWGQPVEFFKKSMFIKQGQSSSAPEIMQVSNDPNIPVEHRYNAVNWHVDLSYEAVPSSMTMLLAMETPQEGGETLFASATRAYEALPPAQKLQIANLIAIHRPRGAPLIEGEVFPPGEGDQAPVRHPVVMIHPVTKRPALYLSATASAIEGWAEEAGRSLIRDLRRHLVKPQFRQQYCARVGDILIWDNYAVAHAATPLEYSNAEGKRRILRRISTKGFPLWLRPATERTCAP